SGGLTCCQTMATATSTVATMPNTVSPMPGASPAWGTSGRSSGVHGSSAFQRSAKAYTRVTQNATWMTVLNAAGKAAPTTVPTVASSLKAAPSADSAVTSGTA